MIATGPRRFVRLALDGGPAWAWERADGLHLLRGAPWADDEVVGVLADAPRLPPFAGTKIIGIGSNYRDHAAEMGKPIPKVPKLFLKAPSAVIGPGDAIEIPPSPPASTTRPSWGW